MKHNYMYKILAFALMVTIGVHAQNPTLQWANQAGAASYDNGTAVVTDAMGNVYATGVFAGTVDFDPGPGTSNLIAGGNYDIYVSKSDSSGNLIWVKQMGGPSYEASNGMTLDGSGHIYITGYFYGTTDFDPGPASDSLTTNGVYDIFVSKLDTSGNFIWAKQFGGLLNDFGYSVAADGSGNVYTTGTFQDVVDFDPGAGIFNLTSFGRSDIFISKLDASGNFVWAKQLGSDTSDYGQDIALDASGNVYTAGVFQHTADFDPGPGVFNFTSAGSYDIFISELDANGNFVRAKQFGGTGADFPNTIITDAAGDIYTAGTFENTVDFDPGAGTFNLTYAGTDDIFISKLDASGNFVWAEQIGGTGFEEITAIALDSMGNLYTTGDFENTVDFDPGVGTTYLTAAPNEDIFISKLDASGNFQWAEQVSGSLYGYANSIATDNYGSVYTIGQFQGTADFDPGPGVSNLTSAGNYDIFILKLNGGGVFTGTNENNSFSTVHTFPNPSNGQVNLAFDHPLDHATLLLLNTTGQTVMEKTGLSGNQFALDLSGIANGVYFIKAIDDNKAIITQKIIKQ